MNEAKSDTTPMKDQSSPTVPKITSRWSSYAAVVGLALSLSGNALQWMEHRNKSRELDQKTSELQLKNRELSQKDVELRLRDEELKQRRNEIEGLRNSEKTRCEAVQAQITAINVQIAQNNANFTKARSDQIYGRLGGQDPATATKEYEATVTRLKSLREKLDGERRELLRGVLESKCPIDVNLLPRGWRPS
ncbi:hypothetical protein [Pseudaquabacterium pictum]|uniref:Uncharacterized protein n=1 Tax=Pseudaquabacterium pictum TaxID=2315236 RepID=A0A480AUY1_9BURK|nr:hypothetical protein [Rubrivivax pictus]GCL62578.1 hypothetical protein AQPW35_16590 [Rubrivivax pictus]